MADGLDTRVVICTRNAYVSSSPLSQAISLGGLLYCSGQVPVSPATGEVPDGIEAQTRQVMDNLKAVLEAAGADMNDAIKSTVYLVNPADITGMNRAYERCFSASPPARTTVIVAGLAKPEWLIEVELVAALRQDKKGTTEVA